MQIFHQCWAQGQECKKVPVLGDAKADEWNTIVYIYIYIHLYIHTYKYMLIQSFKNKQPSNTY